MDLNNFLESKQFSYFVWGVVGLIAILVIFKLGMDIGFKKANFSYQWGENYYRNFAGPAKNFPDNNMMRHDDFMEAHGVFGQIIKIDGSNIIIKDRENTEKIVLVEDDTTIKNFKETIKLSELKTDARIVVIGEPDSAGKIAAKLIRVLPELPANGKEPPMPF